MKYIPLIIVLVLILTIILLIYVGILKFKRKLKQMTKEIYGTTDLKKAAKQAEYEASVTPKSVSAMTSLLLPKITSDFPMFKYDEMKQRVQNTIIQYFGAVTNCSASLLSEGGSDLKLQLENYIGMLSNESKKEYFNGISIHRTEIYRYLKSEGRCIVIFQSSFESMHYVEDETGKIIDGSKEFKEQLRCNTELVYIQDRSITGDSSSSSLGINCPNCGAPITTLGQKSCEYCGTGVIELNIHVWNVESISIV